MDGESVFFFESDDIHVAKSCPVSYWTINMVAQRVGQVSLEWIQIPSDACGQASCIWIRNVCTEIFESGKKKFPDTCVCVDGALIILFEHAPGLFFSQVNPFLTWR